MDELEAGESLERATEIPAPTRFQSRRGEAPSLKYFKGALLHPVNGLMVAGAVTASALLLSPLVLAAGFVFEGVYLFALPRLNVFQRLVDSKIARARKRARTKMETELYRGLSVNQQSSYDGLRLLRDNIERNYRRMGRGLPSLASQSLVQIDALLLSFLRLLDQLNGYRTDLGPTERLKVSEELASLRKDVELELNDKLKEIKRRRVRILERRSERFFKGEENRELISHQLAAIEDLLKLVNEQSLTLRDPSDVSYHLDSLMAEVEETESTVKEMEDFLRLREELGQLDAISSGGQG